MRQKHGPVLVMLFLMAVIFTAAPAVASITNPLPRQVFAPGTRAVDVGWSPTAGVLSTELKLLFNGVEIDRKTGLKGSTCRLTRAFEPGYYTVFVRGVTRTRAGAWSDPVTFIVLRRMKPGDGTVTTVQPVTFKWDASAAATQYRLKLAWYDDATRRYVVTNTLLIPRPAAGNPSWTAAPLKPGRYRWAVTDLRGGKAGFTSSAFFTLAPPAGNYLIVDLSGGTNALAYPVSQTSSVPVGGWTDEFKTSKLVLRKLPAGTFAMGSPYDELGRLWDETPHTVTLSCDFYMGVFEVTQEQWERVMGTRPSFFTNESCYPTRPVEQVCHAEIRELSRQTNELAPAWPANSAVTAASFMGRLRQKTGLGSVDLPTEAQWEYACRAGSRAALNSGKNLSDLYACPNMDKVGRYWYNGGDGYAQADGTNRATAMAGSYKPNAWGLYDMHGNVAEWCLDNFGYYAGDAVDPLGSTWGWRRVCRGGCWYYGFARDCRSASRTEGATPGTHYTGFRVAIGTGQSQTGSLTVVIGPAEAVQTGAQWAVDSGGWQDTGNTVDLSVGTHSVRYKAVVGFTEPASHLVTISNNVLMTVIATYVANDPQLYAVVDLSGTNGGTFPVTYLDREPEGGWTDEDRTARLVLRRVPAGSFKMGSPAAELGRQADEGRHMVTNPAPFYIGVFEVSQGQWERVMGTKPGYFNNPAYAATRPVEQVSYYDIREQPGNFDDPAVDWPATNSVNADSFMGRLRAGTGFDSFDLPTEEQWEYACRAGTETALNTKTNLTALYQCPNMDVAGRYWYNGGSGYRQHDDTSVATARAGSYQPNAWGLYDMHGNVAEWCLDPGSPGAPANSLRMIRGGSWSGAAQDCRSARRDCAAPFARDADIGLRVVW